jgi:hypothetical protein
VVVRRGEVQERDEGADDERGATGHGEAAYDAPEEGGPRHVGGG